MQKIVLYSFVGMIATSMIESIKNKQFIKF